MNWSKKDIETLEKLWGHSDIKNISKVLNRSINAIYIKAYRIGLPRFFESGDYVTLNQFFRNFRGVDADTYNLISYVQNLGLPISNKRSGNKTVRVIKIENFWTWADKHRTKIDFAKFPKGTFGKEPDWVEKLRNRDKLNAVYVRKTKWSRYEDNMLINLLKSYKYTTDNIAKRLNRTEGAVIRRISTLQIPYRPLRNSPHTAWTETEIFKLKQFICEGYDYLYIARQLNRHSEKAIRGRVYQLCGTEVIDRAREVFINEQAEAC